jgi:hypothetical protein
LLALDLMAIVRFCSSSRIKCNSSTISLAISSLISHPLGILLGRYSSTTTFSTGSVCARGCESPVERLWPSRPDTYGRQQAFADSLRLATEADVWVSSFANRAALSGRCQCGSSYRDPGAAAKVSGLHRRLHCIGHGIGLSLPCDSSRVVKRTARHSKRKRQDAAACRSSLPLCFRPTLPIHPARPVLALGCRKARATRGRSRR